MKTIKRFDGNDKYYIDINGKCIYDDKDCVIADLANFCYILNINLSELSDEQIIELISRFMQSYQLGRLNATREFKAKLLNLFDL